METDLELLGVQAAQLKSTLATLHSDLRASRRDMGSLQENLATVQSAAAGVADKVVKMQSQVIAIERQVANAVKVKRRRHVSIVGYDVAVVTSQAPPPCP